MRPRCRSPASTYNGRKGCALQCSALGRCSRPPSHVKLVVLKSGPANWAGSIFGQPELVMGMIRYHRQHLSSNQAFSKLTDYRDQSHLLPMERRRPDPQQPQSRRLASTKCCGSYAELPDCNPAVAAWREYLHRLRIEAPYAYRMKGIGEHASARKAGTELAHCVPRLSNICLVNSGNAAPNSDLSTVLAASADAA